MSGKMSFSMPVCVLRAMNRSAPARFRRIVEQLYRRNATTAAHGDKPAHATTETGMARTPRIDAAMKRDALLASPFFRPMRPHEIDEIIGFAVERRAARGSIIFNKGDDGSAMMAVLAGRVRIGITSPEGKEVTLNVIGPGEIFGEIALLDGKPRSAAAVATEDSTLMVIERRHFLPFLLRHDSLVERLLVVLCDRLRQTSMALEELALVDLPARLARLIAKLSDDYGRTLPDSQGIRIDLKL
jgi:CRP/FNR family cyclic AMP-dependent transcriptional regulator